MESNAPNRDTLQGKKKKKIVMDCCSNKMVHSKVYSLALVWGLARMGGSGFWVVWTRGGLKTGTTAS